MHPIARLRHWLGILTDQELTTLEARDEHYQRATWPILDRAFPPSLEEQEARRTPARDSKQTCPDPSQPT